MDAPADSDENHVRSRVHIAVLRTQEDAVDPGWHEWEANYQEEAGQGADWHALGSPFETTIIS